jgi:microcystin-dependent protein
MADITISGLNTITPARSLTVPASNGSITGKLTLTQVADLIVPIGSIMMWSGSIASIPLNWAICDGNNGTPNLKDRFVVGAGNIYSVSSTGGAATHTLTVSEMPAHNHNDTVTDGTNYNSVMKIDGIHTSNGQALDNANGYGREPNLLFAGYLQSSGGGAAHNNMPPYLALAYIMRIS